MKQKKMANSPLQPPTLATFRSWGIQQELVICRHKSSNFIIRTQYLLGKVFPQKKRKGCMIIGYLNI